MLPPFEPGGTAARGARAHALLFGAAIVAGHPGPAGAHGFGDRYDLPVPLALWVVGAAAAVILSFAIIGVFARDARLRVSYPRVNLLRFRLGLFLASSLVVLPLKLAGVVLLGLTVAAGILGSQNPTANIAPTAVWVLWWVGLAYAAALLGNVWALLDPWNTLFGWAEALARRFGLGDLSLAFGYPQWLGYWPATALFLVFAWVELVFPGRAVPGYLSLLAIGYSIVTWGGMLAFGRAVWRQYGDPFELAFGLLARFAPTEIRVTDASLCRRCPLPCRERQGDCVDCLECSRTAPPAAREWNLRPFGVGFLRDQAVPGSLVAFVILLLSTVTFDGFMATPAWSAIEGALLDRLSGLGDWGFLLVGTLGLVACPLVFVVVYAAFARWVRAAGSGSTTGRVMRAFVLSLVPIAIGYHVAHYLTFLLTQGQRIIPLASDPLGLGWNLFGTAGDPIDIGLVSARFAWYTAVVAIVVGHIVAVWVAHVVAGREFDSRARALRSQYPMLVLMITYTVVSLWVIAQPIVEGQGG